VAFSRPTERSPLVAKVKIRMLVSLAGENFAVTAGDVYECDPAEAARMIEAGFGEPVATSPAKDSRESKRAVSARKDEAA
jgi:hypothetical protein